MGINLIELEDNRASEELGNDIILKLCPYSGIEIQELARQHPDLLVFPYCFDTIKDNLEKENLFTLEGKRIRGGNVAGFIGIGDIRINIHSRFDSNKNQYFIQYMLQKIFGTHLVDLKTESNQEKINDYLIFLFPWALKKAICQGLFKTYRVFKNNDSKVKGTINFPEHIKKNIPYNGCIAYTTREHTTNNYLIHLIRHTIEYISNNTAYSSILHCDHDIINAISVIEQCTPDYDAKNLRQIIFKNLRPKSHPYYTDYTILQRLCLKILRHEKLAVGNNNNQINGVLFNISWLWEEYLASILTNLGFKHLQNNNSARQTPFKIYNKQYQHQALIDAIPDFYCEKKKVIGDAKYKRLENNCISREDRFQLISYLHITQYSLGIILYPTTNSDCDYQQEGTLNGFGGQIGKIGIQIPQDTNTFRNFCLTMQKAESIFCNNLINIGVI